MKKISYMIAVFALAMPFAGQAEVATDARPAAELTDSESGWWPCSHEGQIACVPYYDSSGAAVGYDKYICRHGVYVPTQKPGGC